MIQINQQQIQKIKALTKEYKESYLDVLQGKEHILVYQKEREEVKRLFSEIKERKLKEKEITDDILYKLLPYTNTKYNREQGHRISTWPAVTKDIKKWFENAGWQKRENWPKVANEIFNLIDGLLRGNGQEQILKFVNTEYSKGFQAGIISPIIYCLDKNLLVVNSKVVDTINFIVEQRVIDSRLENYLENIEKIREIIGQLDIDLFKSSFENFDAFCHWMCNKRLGGYARIRKEEKDVERKADCAKKLKRAGQKKKEKIIAIEEKQIGNFFKSLACSEPQPFFVAMGDARNLQKLDSENKIIYNTEFQRGEVWNLPRKQKLIDSILRGYNINAIFFRQLFDGRFECLDGQQRLKTILKEFLKDKFPINPKITPEFNRKTYFSELPESLKSKIKNYPIFAIIFYTDKDDETCKIFLRLQEGLPLNSAEKLNAMIGFLRNEIVELSKNSFVKKLGIRDYRFSYRYILAQIYLLTLRNQIADIKFRNLQEIYSTYKITRPPETTANIIKRIFNFLDKCFGEEVSIVRYNADFISLYSLTKHILENYVTDGFETRLKEFFISFLTKVGEVESSEKEKDAPYYDYKTYRRSSADSRNSIEKRFNIVLSKFLEFVPNIKPKDPTRQFNYWEKLAIYRRDKGICQMCREKIPFEEGSVDHKTPHSKGGPTTIINAQWLCRKCNLKKLDKII